MTSLSKAIKDLARLENRRGDLEQEKASLSAFTIDQDIEATDAKMEAQRAVIDDLQRQEAHDKLAELRKREGGLVAEYADIANQLETIKNNADALALEISGLGLDGSKQRAMRTLAGECDLQALQIRSYEKWYTDQAWKLGYGRRRS